MERVEKFLKEAETYYLATMEGDQPRVRPFGTIHIFDGKLYIQTGKKKEVSKQLHINPKAEMTVGKQDNLCWMHIPPCRKCTRPMMEIQKYFIFGMLRQHFLLLRMSQR